MTGKYDGEAGIRAAAEIAPVPHVMFPTMQRLRCALAALLSTLLLGGGAALADDDADRTMPPDEDLHATVNRILALK
jgi:hypothetical protein